MSGSVDEHYTASRHSDDDSAAPAPRRVPLDGRCHGAPVVQRHGVGVGHQLSERSGSPQLTPLGSKVGQDAEPGVGVFIERSEQVPPSEHAQRVIAVRGPQRFLGAAQEQVVSVLDDGHAGNCRICLAMVSSCICWEPP